MAEEEIVQTESLELSPEESAAIVEGGEPEVVARELPSEGTEVDFTKYEGVSREDIIRQMEAQASNPGDPAPTEGAEGQEEVQAGEEGEGKTGTTGTTETTGTTGTTIRDPERLNAASLF